MLVRAGIETMEWFIRTSGRMMGNGRFPEPARSFHEVGGVDAAEATLEEVHDRLLEWIRPDGAVLANLPSHLDQLTERRDEDGGLDWSLPSLLPSGVPENDRAYARWVGDPDRTDGRCLIFHHAVYQHQWPIWRRFLLPLAEQIPVLFVESPWHFRRKAPGERPGQRTVDPNPLNMYLAIRQWTAEQPLWLEAVRARGWRPLAIGGFSLGGFQTLLATAADVLDLPVISIAATNRYAWGLNNGYVGEAIVQAMAAVGIDRPRLERMARSAELERYVGNIDVPTLYIDGAWDRVDPQPSLDQLRDALNPTHAVRLPGAHGTLLLYRRRIAHEIVTFLRSIGAHA
jgi:pimeloyl-ACP methyl ester carboxylesterase